MFCDLYLAGRASCIRFEVQGLGFTIDWSVAYALGFEIVGLAFGTLVLGQRS